MSTRIADLLDGLHLFQTFSYAELKSLGEHLESRFFAKGKVIFNEGDSGTFMFILISGQVGIFKGGENGHHLMSQEGKGRMVGEMALLDHEKRSATCLAETDCELLLLKAHSLKQMSDMYPALGYKFMFCMAQMLSRRLRRTTAMMADFLNE